MDPALTHWRRFIRATVAIVTVALSPSVHYRSYRSELEEGKLLVVGSCWWVICSVQNYVHRALFCSYFFPGSSSP